jgi:hypothetical protein
LDLKSSHVGFVVDKVALGQVSSGYFGFPCQFSFHLMLHNHLSSGAGTTGRLVADVPRLSHPTKLERMISHDVYDKYSLLGCDPVSSDNVGKHIPE